MTEGVLAFVRTDMHQRGVACLLDDTPDLYLCMEFKSFLVASKNQALRHSLTLHSLMQNDSQTANSRSNVL